MMTTQNSIRIGSIVTVIPVESKMNRYWYSTEGCTISGWCFGSDASEAANKAAAEVRKFYPSVRGEKTFNLSLSPNLSDRVTKVTYHTVSVVV